MQNKYEVIGIVGEGAYGIVYKCRHKETNEFVAIKKFKEIEDGHVKKTMTRELKMLQILRHPNIVDFKEAFIKKGNLYLVFEYVERNLLELIQEKPNGIDPQLIKQFIYQLCQAILYLHQENVIHRDIKPENLLIDNNNKLKLCDFGFARKIQGNSNSNNKEQFTDYVATRWYRAPELLITKGYYGPEVDYWAIGCIMGELADGIPLFPGDNEIDQLICIQKVMGNLPENLLGILNDSGRTIPKVNKPETLERRYMGKLPKQGITFMKELLSLDPLKRLSGEKVLEHPYFESCNKNKEIKGNNHIVTTIHSSSQKNIFPIKIAKEQITHKKVLNIPHNNNYYQHTNDQPPIVTSTTNINVININTFNNNSSKKEDNSNHIVHPIPSVESIICNIPNKLLDQKDYNLPTDKDIILAPLQSLPNPIPLSNKHKKQENSSVISFNGINKSPFATTETRNYSFGLSNTLKVTNMKKKKLILTTKHQYETMTSREAALLERSASVKDLTMTSYIPKKKINGYNQKYNYGINTQFGPYHSNHQPSSTSREGKNVVIEEESAEYNNNNDTQTQTQNNKEKGQPPVNGKPCSLEKVGVYYQKKKNKKHKANCNSSCFGQSYSKGYFHLPVLSMQYNNVNQNNKTVSKKSSIK